MRSRWKFLKKEGAVRSAQICSLIFGVCLVALVCLQTQPAAASVQGTFQRTLQVTGPVSIDLCTEAGSVDVRSGNSGQVLVTGRVKVNNWFGGDAQQQVKRITDNPPIQQNGNDIRIGHISGSELLHNVSISYDLIVPAETRLRSHSGSGSQNLAVASSAVVFLMLIFNLVLLLHSRKHPGPARAAWGSGSSPAKIYG
jgi:hypothetical protein